MLWSATMMGAGLQHAKVFVQTQWAMILQKSCKGWMPLAALCVAFWRLVYSFAPCPQSDLSKIRLLTMRAC